MKKVNKRLIPRPEEERTSVQIRLNAEAAQNAIRDLLALCDVMDKLNIPSLSLRFVENAENKAVTFLTTYATELRSKIGVYTLEQKKRHTHEVSEQIARDVAADQARDAAESAIDSAKRISRQPRKKA